MAENIDSIRPINDSNALKSFILLGLRAFSFNKNDKFCNENYSLMF